jgi:hypothetical protein
MTKRDTLLRAVSQANKAGELPTINALLDAIKGEDRKNMHDTIKSAITDGLLTRERDEELNAPCYRITKMGEQRIKTGAGKQLSPRKTPAGRGDVTPAASEPQTIVDGSMHVADSATVADAVVEPPAQDDLLMPAGSDELQYDPRSVSFNPVSRAEADLDSIISANRKFCGWVSELVGGTQYPLNLYECQNIIGEMVEDMIEEMAEKDARIASLEANRTLPLDAQQQDERFIVSNSFVLADSEQEANKYAIDLAGEISSVVVFRATKAREVRIAWRDLA